MIRFSEDETIGILKEKSQWDQKVSEIALLHWTPDITTNQGKDQVEFYTFDLKGSFVIMVEGITANGEEETAISHFKVVPQ